MTARSYSQSIDLQLPVLPETKDPESFLEFTRVYNAIRLLSQGVDDYTDEGQLAAELATLSSQLRGNIASAQKQLSNLQVQLSELDSASQALNGIAQKYLQYRVPRFKVLTDLEVVAKFGCNGKVPQASYILITTPGTAPATGAGVVAGAFDSAATRDAVLTAITDNSLAITELQTVLKNNGIAI